MIEVTLDTTVRAASRIAARVIDGKAVVIVIDEQKVHTLNGVGTFLFSEIDDAERTVAELIDATVVEFDVERHIAETDIVEFVTQLTQLGALEVTVEAAS